MAGVSRNTGKISWGEPAQIADSKESYTCGRCGAQRGYYGQHFGLDCKGEPLPIIREQAFDVTIFSNSVAAMCWNCAFSFYQILSKEPTHAIIRCKNRTRKSRDRTKKSRGHLRRKDFLRKRPDENSRREEGDL